MAKPADKTAGTFSNTGFPEFDASRAADQFRAFAEKGAEQSKEAYAKMKDGAEETRKAFEDSFEAARSASGDLSLKTISAFRDNVEAGFSHLEALVGARTLSEAVELQASFLRKRVEAGVEQARDFQTAAGNAAETVSAPFRDVFEKVVRELKVA